MVCVSVCVWGGGCDREEKRVKKTVTETEKKRKEKRDSGEKKKPDRHKEEHR